MPNIRRSPRVAATNGADLMRMRASSKSQLSYSIYLTIFITLLLPASPVQSLQIPKQQQQQQQQEDPEARCLNCIRSVTSIGIEPNKRCEGGYFCGPFQFSYQYWAESGKPGNSQGIRDFEKCARDKQCAEQTVRAYFKKFKRDCNNDGVIDCLDMAALHKAGPSGCNSSWFFKSRYWSTFNKTTCSVKRDLTGSVQMDKSELFGNQQQANQQRQVVMKNQTLTTECLDCICEALSSCGSASTNNCGSGLVCGPFAISQAYWKDGRRPGASWTACARTKECSSVTIRNYMDKYKRDCNGDGYLTCEDYAAIHRRGPMSCTNRDLLKEQYWTRFLTCRANQKPSNDANLVKVNEDTQEQADDSSSHAESASNGAAMSTTQSIRGSSISIQSQSGAVTATTSQIPSASTTAQPSTRYRPAYQAASEQAGALQWPTPGTLDQNPTYELNPMVFETKATSNQVRTYQTAQPSHQEDERTEHLLKPAPAREDHDLGGTREPQRDLTEATSQSSPTTSSPSPPPASSQTRSSFSSARPSDYFSPQITQTYQEPDQRRPVIDYSSLPTIIVSKRIDSRSTSRISQPPSVSSKSSDESTSGPPTTTSMATMSPAASSTTTVRYAESMQSTNLDVAAATSSSQHQQHAAHFAAPTVTNEQMVNDQTMDYPMADFGGSGAGVDRANFDRVVNGIVANPDFSKAYPPLPEQIVQRKQPTNASPPRGPHKEATLTTKSSSDNPSTAGQASKRENSKTLSPNIYNTLDASEQAARPEGDHSGLGSLLGPNALNMTSLFEKGLNDSSRIASECLDCICDASSNCDATVQCISKQREKNRCGLYMISWNQYKESDISLTTLFVSPPSPVSSASASSPSASSSQSDDADEKLYYECATDKNCAEKLIHLYIEKYQKDCNMDGKIDCYDIAAIHRVGPDQCNSGKFLSSQYWRDFNHCYTTDRLTTTLQPSLQVSQAG